MTRDVRCFNILPAVLTMTYLPAIADVPVETAPQSNELIPPHAQPNPPQLALCMKVGV